MMLYLKGLSVLAAMGLIAACGGGGWDGEGDMLTTEFST